MKPSKAYEAMEAGAPEPEGARGWIQWKGTDVCMDLTCACGNSPHADVEFLYYWKCSECGTLWALSPHVRLVAMEGEALADASTSPCVHTDNGEDILRGGGA